MHRHTRRTSRLILAALIAGFAAVATPAWGQHIHEDLKLLANDGAAADSFGGNQFAPFDNGVAIDNGIVAVGAVFDDDNGIRSGSAYLFDASTGAQLFKLLSNDRAGGDWFGTSIAIDSGIVAVGAPRDDDNGSSSGSAYLFDAATGVQIAKLLPSDGAADDRFGISIAIDNGIVAVGANRDDDNGSASGSAYLFDATTGLQIAKLLPSDGATGDSFGSSIAIVSNLLDGIVAVGAWGDDDNGLDSGSAYLFDMSTGLQIAKLLPDDGAGGHTFGMSIDIALANGIDNGFVAVGAPSNNAAIFNAGSAYVFNAVTGAQITKVVASDGADGISSFFGMSIAVNNENLVVGGTGGADNISTGNTVYLFDVSTGAQIAMLIASGGAAAEACGFGATIDIDNGTIVTGALCARNSNGVSTGAAYVFGNTLPNNGYHKLLANDGTTGDHLGNAIAIDNGFVAVTNADNIFTGFGFGSAYVFDAITGLQLTQFIPSDGATGDFFGNAVDIEVDNAGNGIVAVGAKWDDDNGGNSGSAYLFDAATGAQLFKLHPSDTLFNDIFGISIAIDNSIVAVGSPGNDQLGAGAGAAYLFDAATGLQIAKLLSSDGSFADRFGESIAMDNGVVAVGAPGNRDNGSNSGSAYLFDVATGLQIAKLLPADNAGSDVFGSTIAIGNGIVAVGAPGDADNGSNSGSVYLFDATTGLQIAKLLPNDGATSDLFGGDSIGVANGVVAVGKSHDDFFQTGAVYLFDVTTGQQIDKLVASDGQVLDWLGWSVAIDDDFVVAGSIQDDYNGLDSGSAYVFDSPAVTAPIDKLLPNDGAAGDLFGWSVDLDNGLVAVGAIHDDDNGSDSGSAYLLDASTGAQVAKLLPNDGAPSDFFGVAIAIDNGVVAVGAPEDDESGTDSGSAYLFDASTGLQIAKLLPNDGAADDGFGFSIAIADGIVAVGAWGDDDNGNDSGSAYLFDASTGIQIAKLLPIDGEASDNFGISIAISNGIVAVGAFADDDIGTNSGSAYLFDALTGTQIAKLLPSDGEAGDAFGASIAIANRVVAVGAFLDDDNGTDSGSVYLFNAFNGAQIDKLLPSDGAAGDQFGRSSISIDNGIVTVGARFDDDNGSNSGSAYLFAVSTGAQIDKLLAFDGAISDLFGFSIAIDNGTVAVGAPAKDDNGADSGAVYLFDAPPGPCPADISGSLNTIHPRFGVPDGITDANDFFYYLNRFEAGDKSIADLTGPDGVPDDILDGLDFFFYLDLFVACRP